MCMGFSRVYKLQRDFFWELRDIGIVTMKQQETLWPIVCKLSQEVYDEGYDKGYVEGAEQGVIE